MKTVKISLANLQGKLNRVEIKSIMAGSGGPYGGNCGNFCNTYCTWPQPCSQTNTYHCTCFA